jgi:hypothetical protein
MSILWSPERGSGRHSGLFTGLGDQGVGIVHTIHPVIPTRTRLGLVIDASRQEVTGFPVSLRVSKWMLQVIAYMKEGRKEGNTPLLSMPLLSYVSPELGVSE